MKIEITIDMSSDMSLSIATRRYSEPAPDEGAGAGGASRKVLMTTPASRAPVLPPTTVCAGACLPPRRVPPPRGYWVPLPHRRSYPQRHVLSCLLKIVFLRAEPAPRQVLPRVPRCAKREGTHLSHRQRRLQWRAVACEAASIAYVCARHSRARGDEKKSRDHGATHNSHSRGCERE